jgi:hypothetical protein
VYNKIFSGYQPRQMVKIRKHRRFEVHLCPRPQGSEVVEIPNRVIYVPAQAPCTLLRASQRKTNKNNITQYKQYDTDIIYCGIFELQQEN